MDILKAIKAAKLIFLFSKAAKTRMKLLIDFAELL